MNIAVFASGNGTDLDAIIDAKKRGQLASVELVFVLSDKKDSGALAKARGAGIKNFFVNPRGKTREEFDQECLVLCRTHSIDYIFLVGYMRIVSSVLVRAFAHRIVNVHPSLLPKYAAGMDTDVHAAVIKNGEKKTGYTFHFVTEDLDAGPIIVQNEIAVEPDDTPETLKARVQEGEKKGIVEVIERLALSV